MHARITSVNSGRCLDNRTFCSQYRKLITKRLYDNAVNRSSRPGSRWEELNYFTALFKWQVISHIARHHAHLRRPVAMTIYISNIKASGDEGCHRQHGIDNQQF